MTTNENWNEEILKGIKGGHFHKIKAITEFTEKSDLEMTEFIENVKESFENVYIISIESLPMNYDKYNKYTYKVKFYQDLNLKF
jgi:hypothetical protein